MTTFFVGCLHWFRPASAPDPLTGSPVSLRAISGYAEDAIDFMQQAEDAAREVWGEGSAPMVTNISTPDPSVTHVVAVGAWRWIDKEDGRYRAEVNLLYANNAADDAAALDCGKHYISHEWQGWEMGGTSVLALKSLR